jgi:hypothetical protein
MGENELINGVKVRVFDELGKNENYWLNLRRDIIRNNFLMRTDNEGKS